MKEDYSRVLILTLIAVATALFIMINYNMTAGVIYVMVGLVILVLYSNGELIRSIYKQFELVGIDDWDEGIAIGLLGGIAFIGINMLAPALSLGLPKYSLLPDMDQLSQLCVVSILAPILEEGLFRGIIYSFIRNYVDPILSAFTVGGIFSLYHYTSYGGYDVSVMASFVSAMLFGALVCIITDSSKNILPGTVMHSMVNTYTWATNNLGFTLV